MRTVPLVASSIDAAAFAPFGWLPLPDTDPDDGVQTLHFEWDDEHVNVIAHTADEVERTPDGVLLCDRFFRHDTHTQVLMPLDVEAVLAVAPAEIALDDPAHLDRARAFLLEPGEAIVLHRGTWHWGPYPLGEEPVRLFNVQGRRFLDDNRRADLSVTGARLGVTVPRSLLNRS
ncbi:MAG: ureidoglycolate lyase [Actinomycetes bacterium]